MMTALIGSSAYNRRTVAIEVTGLCHQNVMRESMYTLKVPYSSLTFTLQSIRRMGGMIANVTIGCPIEVPLAETTVAVAQGIAATSVAVASRTTKISEGFGTVQTAKATKSPTTTLSKTKSSNTRSTKQKRR